VALVKEMRGGLDEVANVEKVVCPPFVSLQAVRDLLKGTSIKLGAQNLYFEEKGAYTGEVSPLMVAELCEYVILGHSERRQYFNETVVDAGNAVGKFFQPVEGNFADFAALQRGQREDIVVRADAADTHDVAPDVKAGNLLPPGCGTQAAFQTPRAYGIQALEGVFHLVEIFARLEPEAPFDGLIQLLQSAPAGTLP